MKLFRKIRQKFINDGSLNKYLLYAIGEILLVMIGILLAFQVSKWYDNSVKKTNKIKYYQNIKDQIVEERDLINGELQYNNRIKDQFKYANKIIENNDRSKIDTLGLIVRNLIEYSDFDKQSNIYETMVNSGQIKLLNNHEIIDLIRILEERYTYLNRMENIHYDAVMQYSAPAMISTIKMRTGEIMRPEEIYSFQFQNLILLLIRVMEEKTDTYISTIGYIDRTVELIDKELENR